MDSAPSAVRAALSAAADSCSHWERRVTRESAPFGEGEPEAEQPQQHEIVGLRIVEKVLAAVDDVPGNVDLVFFFRHS